MSEINEELRARARVLRELRPDQRRALGHPNPDNIDWEAWEELERVHEEELERSEGYNEELGGETLNIVTREKLERQRNVEKLRSQVSELQANTSGILKDIAEIQLKKKKRNEDWERQYGKNVVALVHHPFRSKSVTHKEDR